MPSRPEPALHDRDGPLPIPNDLVGLHPGVVRGSGGEGLDPHRDRLTPGRSPRWPRRLDHLRDTEQPIDEVGVLGPCLSGIGEGDRVAAKVASLDSARASVSTRSSVTSRSTVVRQRQAPPSLPASSSDSGGPWGHPGACPSSRRRPPPASPRPGPSRTCLTMSPPNAAIPTSSSTLANGSPREEVEHRGARPRDPGRDVHHRHLGVLHGDDGGGEASESGSRVWTVVPALLAHTGHASRLAAAGAP